MRLQFLFVHSFLFAVSYQLPLYKSITNIETLFRREGSAALAVSVYIIFSQTLAYMDFPPEQQQYCYHINVLETKDQIDT